MLQAFETRVIAVPRITVFPKVGEVTSGFNDFDLDLGSRNFEAIREAIKIRNLVDGTDEVLKIDDAAPPEAKPEFYVIRHIIDFSDINYDEHQTLIGKLATQAVDHIRKRLGNEVETILAVRSKERDLANLIHSELQKHYWERTTGYDVRVSQGFEVPKPVELTRSADIPIQDIRTTLENKRDIRQIVFTGFKRCVFPYQKFDSNPERLMALVLDGDGTVDKWLKPTIKDIIITLGGGERYKPDFIVETKTTKHLCEIKLADNVEAAAVKAKTEAALTWCEHATTHEAQHPGAKPWTYLLIPHDKVDEGSTLAGLAARFTFRRA